MGKPLISYSIRYAESSNLIDKIFVSTDGNKIASISEKFGAEVIIRPRNISGDTVPNEPVISHALNYIKKIGLNFDIVFLQPTSPLRQKYELDKAIKLLIDKNLDTVFSSNDYLPFIWKKKKRTLFTLKF